MTITIELQPDEQARLEMVASGYGESPEQAARRIIGRYLQDDGFGPLTDEDWAQSARRMAAEILPAEDWGETAPPARQQGGDNGAR